MKALQLYPNLKRQGPKVQPIIQDVLNLQEEDWVLCPLLDGRLMNLIIPRAFEGVGFFRIITIQLQLLRKPLITQISY